MDNYFSFVPYELLEQILPYLNNEELESFIFINDEYKYILNWINIFII